MYRRLFAISRIGGNKRRNAKLRRRQLYCMNASACIALRAGMCDAA
jgi:hypothetical protein